MAHPVGSCPTPLNAEEMARGVAAFAPIVAEALAVNGRYRVRAATPDTVELFQAVARRAGEVLRRPVISYTDRSHIVIAFAEEGPLPAVTVERDGTGTAV